jgi:hypothetical protein
MNSGIETWPEFIRLVVWYGKEFRIKAQIDFSVTQNSFFREKNQRNWWCDGRLLTLIHTDKAPCNN